jgi:hypothetical protein
MMRQGASDTKGIAKPSTRLGYLCMVAGPAKSQDNNVFSLRTLLTTSFGKTNGLPFGQGFETRSLDGTEMHEQVAAVVPADETESFALIEPLDGSFLLL